MQGVFHLSSRSVIEVKGPEASVFLQNVFTNDIDTLSDEKPLQYSLLLSPQGQILHEVFILRRDPETFWVDIWAPRKADLVRRLTMFRLRAKVDINNTEIKVYAGNIENGIDDPRVNNGILGKRYYKAQEIAAEPEAGYHDLCISNGIATAQAIRFEKDFTHDLGLQKLNAVAWDKGCFIGQEVAARVEHRGLAKKELRVVSGNSALILGPITVPEGAEVGEIRDIASDGKHALAVIKKIALENSDLLGVDAVKILVKRSFG